MPRPSPWLAARLSALQAPSSLHSRPPAASVRPASSPPRTTGPSCSYDSHSENEKQGRVQPESQLPPPPAWPASWTTVLHLYCPQGVLAGSPASMPFLFLSQQPGTGRAVLTPPATPSRPQGTPHPEKKHENHTPPARGGTARHPEPMGTPPPPSPEEHPVPLGSTLAKIQLPNLLQLRPSHQRRADTGRAQQPHLQAQAGESHDQRPSAPTEGSTQGRAWEGPEVSQPSFQDTGGGGEGGN